ncbi:Inorganic triphosphatase YgiF, contains CYTH and CHAD domains [Nitrosospira briensis]|uniref:Inorganic triphosphatase YgiF, contains CYTH and CHAD domains n=1 Tax=Nitrosospira briensis TaxID=35799 RepID=A0A1I5AQ51_9PROT|nr:CYTH and CHAD domain-containing protein [Nitrosospira briensis]SFN64510.1 Inorganic triphosphatase YgiF, contains CYTH and CHAD domains [Nitrosospira briensis]
MPTEIELKLRLPADSIVRLQRHPLLKSLSTSRPVAEKIHTVYYDTSDYDLKRNNVAFRLRRIGKNWIQSIKGGGSAVAGLHQRYEWEAPVLGAQPEFKKIPNSALGRIFDSDTLCEQLRPLFTTEFKRSTRSLRFMDNTEAELCLDQGKIVAGNVSMPFCEIELELKSGSPLPLFQLALDLLPAVPLRLESVSKAERGYRLASGDKPPMVKAAQVSIVTEMSSGEAFQVIVRNCLDHLHSNEAGMLECGDIEYLHQMRVALRRVRSAFSIFSKAFSKSAFVPVTQELKWLSGQLGPARDWDVFVTETLADICTQFPGHAEMMVLQEKCEQIRRHHNDVARKAIGSTRYTEMMLRLGAWLNAESWPVPPGLPVSTGLLEVRAKMPAKEFSTGLLAHRHKQLKKYGRKLKNLSPRALHSMRIVAKKQRYAAEFFAALYPHGKTKRYIKSLAELQDVLGGMNDTVVAGQLLSELPAGENRSGEHEAIGIVLGWAASVALAEKTKLNRTWAGFERNSPFW